MKFLTPNLSTHTYRVANYNRATSVFGLPRAHRPGLSTSVLQCFPLNLSVAVFPAKTLGFSAANCQYMFVRRRCMCLSRALRPLVTSTASIHSCFCCFWCPWVFSFLRYDAPRLSLCCTLSSRGQKRASIDIKSNYLVLPGSTLLVVCAFPY